MFVNDGAATAAVADDGDDDAASVFLIHPVPCQSDKCVIVVAN